ncbi:cytochrome c oxidase subunit II [Arcticibacter tournemirensis]|uniref:Cytochrome c oxidase subunit 2 n=1 Tax=Arcticibacter tournemirensis TaxID=699437 RepID=A0A4Q0M485_9SPHI|nr:cytochrome c oxidase subunit II [Arcticibacter tournemirensis]RXF67509.1 cytochrome c oxidase subunit II [Arcticibacter tournemirensis]
MRFNKFLNIRSFFAVLILYILVGSANVFARQTGGATEGDMVAADTAQQINSETGTIGDTPTAVSESGTDAGTTLATADEVVKDTTLYKSVAFYVTLFLLLCIFIGVIGKVLKVYELTREIQGKREGVNWNKVQAALFLVALVTGFYGTYWTYDTWGNVASGESASEHGLRIDTMMMVTITITTIVFVITQFLLFTFAFRYKGSEKRKAYFYPHNNAIERLWTIIPALVLTALVVFGFFTWRSITNPPEDEMKNALSIEVTGEQFKWNVRYAGDDNQLGVRNYKLTTPINGLGIDFTDRKSWDDKLGGEIVIPKGRPVRFTINSKDILHSFYIPEFRVQMNAVPGMPTYFQFTPRLTTEEMREKTGNAAFDFVLLCNKICGTGHYNMQYKVRVVDEKEFKDWLVKQPLYYNDDIKKDMQQKMVQSNAAPDNKKIALNNQ